MQSSQREVEGVVSRLDALQVFFKPRSVAVIGASRREGSVGNEIVRNLIECGYPGKIYPINPKAEEIRGIPCYRSILKVKDEIDLGVIAVPAPIVPKVAEEAGRKGVKCLIVISAGFSEIGAEGLSRERELKRICKEYGVRLLGPNCLGLLNTTTPLNASFARQLPLKGGIAFISQSGALCTSVLDWAVEENIGFSNVISLGNMVDTDETDFMEVLAGDPNTKVILVYLEGIRNGREFLDVAPRVVKTKPVVILKSGVSDVGARAVASHTGSIAGSKVAYETAFRQSGVLQAHSIEELFNLGLAFSSQPPPKGRNVAIVTNAGGPSIVATDACSTYGLNLAWISPDTIAKLRTKLPKEASWINPIDVLGDALADRYAFALKTVLMDEAVDAAVVILTPQAMTQPLKTAKEIVEIRRQFRKPILAVFMGGESVEEARAILLKEGIPNYLYPEKAIFTLAGMAKYVEFQNRTYKETIPAIKADRESVANIFERVRRERRVSLLTLEGLRVAKAYGIPVPKSDLAQSRARAEEIAEEIGYPVAMKVVSPQILHKTDIGGVKLNLTSRESVGAAFNDIMRNVSLLMPEAHVLGVEVQKMVPKGREVIIGMHRDIQFGPLIMFGLGGIYVNILKDVSFRFAPVSRKAAYEMITETKAYAILRGIRGETSSDIDAIVDVITKVSQLSLDFEEINEMDINPLFVYERGKGVLALDVKVTIAQ